MSQYARITIAMEEVLRSAFARFHQAASLGANGASPRGWTFMTLLITVLAVATWGDAKSFLWALSGVSFLCVGMWWILFVSQTHSVSTKTSLHLMPRLRLVVGWLVLLIWIGLAFLLMSGFFLGHWFFAAVAAIWLSLLTGHYRKVFVVLTVAGLMVVCGVLSMTGNWYGPSDAVAHKLEMLAGMWALCASLLGLIGVSRVFPILGGALWVAWIGAMLLSKQLIGLSFTELLLAIYAASGQTTTHLAAAIALGGLMLFGIVIKGRQGSAQDLFLTGDGVGAGFNRAWRAHRLWSAPPGYDFCLARACRWPHAFGKLLPFTFGRHVHWTTLAALAVGHAALVAASALWLTSASSPALTTPWPILIWVAFVPFTSLLVGTLVRATFRARRAHQLLSLTPRWPSASSLNKALARLYAQHCLVPALAGMGILGGFHLVYGLKMQAMWLPAASILFVVLLGYANILRPYKEGETINVAFAMIGWFVVTQVPVALLAIATLRYEVSPWAGLMLLVAALTVAIWRYRSFISDVANIPAAPSEY